MIRINLLEHLPAPTERLQAMLNPGRSGGFISRREVVLGGLFLGLALAILGTQLWFRQEDLEPEAPSLEAAVETPAPRPASPPAAPPAQAQPDPLPVAELIVEAPPAEPDPPAREPSETARPATAGAPLHVTALQLTPLATGLDVFVSIAGAPTVRSFRVDNPNRVVFDIPGATLDIPDAQRNQVVDGELVQRVRIAQNTLDPPLVRLVLETPVFPAVEISSNDAGVSLRIRQP
ncbi:MAG: AMIN domain-containing protein [Acidobacteria bacterium]|nr:AMIN domain-containing protein [Acidobacteriota bacterium]